MQIPILSGVFADNAGDFRTSYPRNYIPVPKNQGISEGYLRPADGAIQNGTGPGVSRGGINWRGQCYRVLGTKLVRIAANGSHVVIGDVGAGGRCSFAYSFDRLAVTSGRRLYYWNGVSFVQVTDPDLGAALDITYVDGYFMTTDGEFLVVTELNDPTAVDPLKYGSAELDPDPLVRVLKVRNEPHAVGRYTIEVFTNIGGPGFPFQRNEGAQIHRGAVGTHAAIVFDADKVAFVGGGLNEPCAVYLGGGGTSSKISTREIDTVLQTYSEVQLADVVLESRIDKAHKLLLVHLPDQTLAYDAAASEEAGAHVWFTLDSGLGPRARYRARDLVWCYDRWLVADPTGTAHGYLTPDIGSHFGATVSWEFGTQIVYNEGRGAIFHEVELVGAPGGSVLGADPVVWTQYSLDGRNWSNPRPARAGKQGETLQRLVWRLQGTMRHYRMQRFIGTSDVRTPFARLEAQIEGLA